MYRAAACSMILKWQLRGSWFDRSHRQALNLVMAVTWLVNGLHSAPDFGRASRDLLDNILPHVNRRGAEQNELAYGTALDSDADEDELFSDYRDDEGDDEDGSRTRVWRRRRQATLPAYPYGLAFLRDIQLEEGHVPRFSENGRFVTGKTFEHFFGCAEVDILRQFLHASVIEHQI